MPLSTAELQQNVTNATARLVYLSLHTGYPATTANEVTGGSPAYARKLLAWGAPNASGDAVAGALTFDVPATTVAAVGFTDTLTGGTVRADINVTDEVFAAQGQYVFTATLDGSTT